MKNNHLVNKHTEIVFTFKWKETLNCIYNSLNRIGSSSSLTSLFIWSITHWFDLTKINCTLSKLNIMFKLNIATCLILLIDYTRIKLPGFCFIYLSFLWFSRFWCKRFFSFYFSSFNFNNAPALSVIFKRTVPLNLEPIDNVESLVSIFVFLCWCCKETSLIISETASIEFLPLSSSFQVQIINNSINKVFFRVFFFDIIQTDEVFHQKQFHRCNQKYYKGFTLKSL